jgi:hypothetical protein
MQMLGGFFISKALTKGDFIMKKDIVIEKIALNKLTADPEINPRKEVDNDNVERLVKLIKQEVRLRPIIVFKDEDVFNIVDGFHRYAAYKKVGENHIQCKVREGTREKAMIHACSSNVGHGKRLTNDDKRRIVTRLLTIDKSKKWSDGKIAEKCGVSQPFVSKLRHELKSQNGYEPPKERVSKKGVKIDVTNIGKNSSLSKKRKKDHRKSNDANFDDKDKTEITDSDYKEAAENIAELKMNLKVLSEICKDRESMTSSKFNKVKKAIKESKKVWVSLSEFMTLIETSF